LNFRRKGKKRKNDKIVSEKGRTKGRPWNREGKKGKEGKEGAAMDEKNSKGLL